MWAVSLLWREASYNVSVKMIAVWGQGQARSATPSHNRRNNELIRDSARSSWYDPLLITELLTSLLAYLRRLRNPQSLFICRLSSLNACPSSRNPRLLHRSTDLHYYISQLLFILFWTNKIPKSVNSNNVFQLSMPSKTIPCRVPLVRWYYISSLEKLRKAQLFS